MADKPKYLDLLRDPRWQKKRLEILSRDGWKCVSCADETTTLNVHHRFYISHRMPWEYLNSALVTLCENCHRDIEKETSEQRNYIAGNPQFSGCMFSDWEHAIEANLDITTISG